MTPSHHSGIFQSAFPLLMAIKQSASLLCVVATIIILSAPHTFRRIVRYFPTWTAATFSSEGLLVLGNHSSAFSTNNSNTADKSQVYPQQPNHTLLGPTTNLRLGVAKISTSSINKYYINMGISYELLKQQNAETSNTIIEHWASSAAFAKLAKFEGDLTVNRDQEDADKLQVGIDYAKEKGVIDPKYVPEPYVNLDVLGKTPDQVATEILDTVGKNAKGDAGSVIVLCGLSGTGKGTTVSKLRSNLEETGKEVVTWSNGNIFRSVTLLAATWCEQQDGLDGFNKEKALTKDNLGSFISMLSFSKNEDGQYDTRIQGLGLDLYVSKVQNTELKSAKVSKNIPTVAEVTQGEVILFAAKAVETLRDAGKMVLLEGREQTVNYVKTPHRFILMLSDESLIGKRRAAQRVMAGALDSLGGNTSADEAAVSEALQKTLDAMVAEVK